MHLSYVDAHPDARFDALFACDTCGFHQVHPLPTPESLSGFYQHYAGSAGYSRKEKKKINRTRARLKRLRRYVRTGSFLDVGANMGFAVQAAHLEGYDAHGIEIDEGAVAQARARYEHLTFHATMIEDYQPPAAYDLVHCAEVIEHVPDVHAFMHHLARMLKPGGYLYLTTPDIGHVRVPRDIMRWGEIKPPEHISWFTKQSLRLLLEAHGLQMTRVFFNLKPGLRVVAHKPAF